MKSSLPARFFDKKYIFIKLDKTNQFQQLVHHLSGDRDYFQQIIVVVQKGVPVKIREQFFSDDSDLCIFRSIIFILLPGAYVTYSAEQRIGIHTKIHTQFSILAYDNSSFNGWLADEGPGQRAWLVSAQMLGKYAEIFLRMASWVRGIGRTTIISQQKHCAPETRSKFIVKGLVRDKALMKYDGLIEIEVCAVGAQADLQHAALLLSDEARAAARPALEVLTHEVMCSHGSAIGRLDQDQLWYLQARGISEKKAQGLLIDAFMKEVLPAF